MSGDYVLWNEIDYDLIRVSPPKKNETEISTGKSGKKGKKVTWRSCTITYLYEGGEDHFRVMWNALEVTGISTSEFDDKTSGKTIIKEQIGGYGFLRPEHREVRDKIKAKILQLASEYKDHKDADEEAWDSVKPENKKVKLYWVSKEDKKKARVYFPISKQTKFYTVSRSSKDGWKPIPKKNLIETEDVKLQITADVVEYFKYLYIGQNTSIMYEMYQALVKKLSAKDSTPIFKKPSEEIDEDAIDSALRDLNEKKKQTGGDDDDDDEAPRRSKPSKKKSSGRQKMDKVLNDSSDEDEDEEDEEPKKGKKNAKDSKDPKDSKKKKDESESESEEDEEEEEKPKKKDTKKGKKKEEEEEEEEEE